MCANKWALACLKCYLLTIHLQITYLIYIYTYIYIYIYIYSAPESPTFGAIAKVNPTGVQWRGLARDIGPAVRVFANGPGDLGSIPGRVIPKTLKMELDTTLLNTQHYKVRFKGKVEQSREWSSALPYTLVVAIEKGAFGSPSTMVANFTLQYIYIYIYKQDLALNNLQRLIWHKTQPTN